MEETEGREGGDRKRTKQQITVPFLWEEKPGIAKKDWKPQQQAPVPDPAPAPPLPTKYIVSIPFRWEEKPGTPLRCFQKGSPETMQDAESKCLPLPPAYYQDCDDLDGDGDDYGGADDDDRDWISEIELETLSTDTGDSFSSAPSLLANGLMPSSTISSAIPLDLLWIQESVRKHRQQLHFLAFPRDFISLTVFLFQDKETQNIYQMEAPSSPESSASMSSYATGTTSLAGASFLERLFPLYSPRSGLLKKTGKPNEKGTRSATKLTPQQWHKDPNDASTRSITRRRPLTLGELITLSRRRSCRRKAVQMRKQSLSEDMIKERPTGCCMFGAADSAIQKLLAKKNLLSLKLA